VSETGHGRDRAAVGHAINLLIHRLLRRNRAAPVACFALWLFFRRQFAQ